MCVATSSARREGEAFSRCTAQIDGNFASQNKEANPLLVQRDSDFASQNKEANPLLVQRDSDFASQNKEDFMQFEQLQKDMIAAMKARDKVRKDAISTLVSAAKKAAIDEGCRDDIKEELVDRVILKEIKSVKEQIDTCPNSREDLKEEYQTRYDIFMEYAPKMMSAEEVEAFIKEKFADVLAGKNKGMIMKNVMPELKGKADGSVINQVVAKLCQ